VSQKVIVTRGLPGSGKSTWTKAWTRKHPDYKRINRDDLRMMIYHGKWSQKKEEAILLARQALIVTFLTEGYNIVLDDTNLVPARMEETRQVIEDCATMLEIDVKITVKDFTDVPLETCIARDAERPKLTRVGERFIRQYYNKYVKQ
jgi:predicted kinase